MEDIQSPNTTSDAVEYTPQPSTLPMKGGGKDTADELLKAYEQEQEGKESRVEEEAEHKLKVEEAAAKKAVAKEIVKNLDKAPEEVAEPEATREESEADFIEALSDDGSTLKIPRGAKLTLQVNGKPFPIAVDDAVKAALVQEAFNRGMDRRVTFLSQREKAVEERERGIEGRLSGIQDRISKAVAAARQGQALPAIKALSLIASGGDPQEAIAVEREMLSRLEETTNVFTKMSQAEREAYFAKREVEELKRQNEAVQSRASEIEALQKTDLVVKEECERLGIPQEQFVGLYHLICKDLVGEGKRFSSVKEIGPAEVASVHTELMISDRVRSAISSVDKAILDTEEGRRLELDLFQQAMFNPNLQESDLQYIIEEIVTTPSKSVENLNRKVERAKSQRLQSTVKQGSAAQRGEDDPDADAEWDAKLRRSSWAVQQLAQKR